MEAAKDAKEIKREHKEEELPSTSVPDEAEEKCKEEEQPVVKSEREVCAGPSTAAVSEGEPSCSHHRDDKTILQIINNMGEEMTRIRAAQIAAPFTNKIQEDAKFLESSHQPETPQVKQLLSTMSDLIDQVYANVQQEHDTFQNILSGFIDCITHKVGSMQVGGDSIEAELGHFRRVCRHLVLVYPTICIRDGNFVRNFNWDGDDDDENHSAQENSSGEPGPSSGLGR